MDSARLTALKAREGTWPEFMEVLEANGLPTQDLLEHGQFFYALTQDDRPVAFGGYALRGSDVLLRSIVVPGALRGQGHGARMLDALMTAAARSGATHAWLLTMTPTFFQHHGFTTRSRSECPPDVAATPEFRSICPASASLMAHKLTP